MGFYLCLAVWTPDSHSLSGFGSPPGLYNWSGNTFGPGSNSWCGLNNDMSSPKLTEPRSSLMKEEEWKECIHGVIWIFDAFN